MKRIMTKYYDCFEEFYQCKRREKKTKRLGFRFEKQKRDECVILSTYLYLSFRLFFAFNFLFHKIARNVPNWRNIPNFIETIKL